MNSKLPTSDLVIRPASFSDIPFIQDVASKTWPSTYIPILGSEQVEYMLEKFYSTSSLEQQMKNQHYFFLALKNYNPIGFASMSQVENEIFKLQKLYVIPTEQKAGAGKALIENVQTVAKSMGGTRLQLNVNRKNPTLNFYIKKGFSIIKEVDIDIENGYFMNDYIMEKAL